MNIGAGCCCLCVFIELTESVCFRWPESSLILVSLHLRAVSLSTLLYFKFLADTGVFKFPNDKLVLNESSSIHNITNILVPLHFCCRGFLKKVCKLKCWPRLSNDCKSKSNNLALYFHFLTVMHLQVATVYGGFGSAACLSHDQEGRKTLTLNMGWSRWKLLAWLSELWGDERCHYLFMSPKCRAEEMGMADPES